MTAPRLAVLLLTGLLFAGLAPEASAANDVCKCDDGRRLQAETSCQVACAEHGVRAATGSDERGCYLEGRPMACGQVEQAAVSAGMTLSPIRGPVVSRARLSRSSGARAVRATPAAAVAGSPAPTTIARQSER